MLLIGLTGSIGMGKSATAQMFRDEGVPVYDADAAVHALYDKGGEAVEPVGAAFPGAVRDGAVNRAALGDLVRGKPDEIKRLEAIIHPLVAGVQLDWLAERDSEGAPMVVLDIPLLYETGGDARVDVVVVVSAPAEVQRARVLERPGMTPDMFDFILSKQVPDAEKPTRADFIVETGRGFDHARTQVRAILKDLEGRTGTIWPRRN